MEPTPKDISVSRETFRRLRTFCSAVEKWNKTINLVSSSSLPLIWERHVIDSLQITQSTGSVTHWADLGSGGGFPGLVAAAVLHETDPAAKVSLVESDARKCSFLRAAAREMGVAVDVYNERIEEMPPLKADVISARALASLDMLLGLAERHTTESTRSLFLKGRTYNEELTQARKNWHIDVRITQSNTDPASAILEVRNFSRV